MTLRAAVLAGTVALALPVAAGAEVPRWQVWLCHLAVLSPRQGLHAADVNIALGALINLIRAETKAYAASH